MRYLKVSILIGILVSFALAGLYEAGLFQAVDKPFAEFLGYPAPSFHLDFALQYTLLAVFAIGIAWTSIDISSPLLKSIIAAGAMTEVLGATGIAHIHGIFFSPFCSLTAIATSFGIGLAYSRTEAGRRKQLVQELFGARISRRTSNALINSHAALQFSAQKCEASVLVCEIFNHALLSSALPVADYVAMNNAFLANAADYLVERGGYLEEGQGETLRVIFGAPLADSRHAITACEAALGLISRLDAVNDECATLWQQRFDYRIGINSGDVIVATYGSQRLAHVSVSGEPVEFARRLCRVNTIYGSHLLIGAATFAHAERFMEVRPMEIIERHPENHSQEEIYEVLCLRNQLSESERQRRDDFWKAMILYRQRLWNDSLTLLHQIQLDSANDGPVEFYIRRIQQLVVGLPELEVNPSRL